MEYIGATGTWSEVEQREVHKRRFANNDYRIIAQNGEDVGVVALEITDSSLKLNQIFVLPEFQGTGIGKRCMEELEKEARELNLPLALQVRKLNTSAMGFYNRLGYESFDETEHHIQFIKLLGTQQTKR